MPTRLERFTTFLLRNRWQTMLLVFVASFVPVLGIIGTLVAALVTLVKGIGEGALLMLVATLPYICSFFLVGNHDVTLPIAAWAAVGVAVLSNTLTWVFAAMLHRKASWNTVFQVAALIGVVVICGIHLVYPDVADWWGVQLQAYYEQAQAVTQQLKNAAGSSVAVPTLGDSQREAIQVTRSYATGVMTAFILFNAMIQLIVARWWQAIVFNPGSLRRELRNIRLSKLAGGLFILSLVLSYFDNSVITDIMPVLYLLFAAAGLSLIHYLIGLLQSPMVWFWLVFLYISIIFALPLSLWLVGILGLLDVWMDIRKKVGIRH
jgi:hypothetical protein